MKFAYLVSTGRGTIDPMLAQIAERLHGEGKRLAGVVQFNTARTGSDICDMDVKVLPDGPINRISQSLGAHSTGCRLNPEALEQSVAAVDASLSAQTELLIINKFGKHEGEGRGFCATIGRALELEVPVLIGVNRLNLEAFLGFSGGMAEELVGQDAVLAWAKSSIAASGKMLTRAKSKR